MTSSARKAAMLLQMMSKQPRWVRLSDLLSGLFNYGVAGIGGVGILVYQAVVWFLYTEFNYMSLDWFFGVLQLPFSINQSSWYHQPQMWMEFHKYLLLFCEWMPLSITLIIVGKFIGGWIDTAAMNYGRSHPQSNEELPGTRGLGA